MDERIAREIELLRRHYPDLVYKDRWVLLPHYQLTEGWVPRESPIAFFIRDGFPGVSPYGIHVPAGILFQGNKPNNYTEPSNPQPPFDGNWGVFSWEASNWHPTANPETGHNLVNWALGFANRFKEGV